MFNQYCCDTYGCHALTLRRGCFDHSETSKGEFADLALPVEC